MDALFPPGSAPARRWASPPDPIAARVPFAPLMHGVPAAQRRPHGRPPFPAPPLRPEKKPRPTRATARKRFDPGGDLPLPTLAHARPDRLSRSD
jgi:hypothetical protein